MEKRMPVTEGQIVKNLIINEPVLINKIQTLGNMYSIAYVGINTKRANTKVVDEEVFSKLEVLGTQGSFSFSGDAKKFKIYAEAERISSAFQFDPLFAVNCSIVDPLPHQIEAVYKHLLPLPKIRFLLADDTGAGKTIMTGLLLKELLMRGSVERILIITPGGLTKQWQEEEMGLKFSLPFKLVNRASFQSDPLIFMTSDRIITSIDFLRNEDVLNIVKETSWDIIIVDEAHKLSAYEYGSKRYVSKRYEALQTLSTKCDHLLLLTATPHRGRKDTFRNLLQLLDEDIFASDSMVTSRIQDVGKKGVNKFFIRRLKEEMKDWSGDPLFKPRYTKTVLYELTEEEKNLYDSVTEYLTRRRREAHRQSNIHVSLALMVMQRRLTSSIYAIMKTLRNRYNALKGLLEELNQNPGLWEQKQKIDLDIRNMNDFDDFDDEERESLENILSDPRKCRFFTTAKSPTEIREEAEQVKKLVVMAESLYAGNTEERKFRKLRELLQSEGVLDENEKIVIFTEHKDTLDYLNERLSNNGYIVSTIHGRKNVDERQEAQRFFAREAQILLATDAAGEGINLQFCRLLINWDIPWNPNRLEQRMGRIHRYGQQKDVLVFNMAAQNTREGKVLVKLLDKLNLIREQMGDDRVYDVISDIFEDVGMDDIINSVFNGEFTGYDTAIEEKLTEESVKGRIEENRNQLGTSVIDYTDARELKSTSDEKRLQPVYIQMFFQQAFSLLGGSYTEITDSIYRIDSVPDSMLTYLKRVYNISEDIFTASFCFDKKLFLDYSQAGTMGRIIYINPGNPIFDSLIAIVKNYFREEMLKGTVLISPFSSECHLSYFVRSRITDNRPHRGYESVADERLIITIEDGEGNFETTSPARFIDLQVPEDFSKTAEPPEEADIIAVTEWVFTTVTLSQYEETARRVQEDVERRKEYLEEAFTGVIFDITEEINKLQEKVLYGDSKASEQVVVKQEKIKELSEKKEQRIEALKQMTELSMKPPEVLGCAFVVPLTEIEFKNHYGMSRDDESEASAMSAAMQYEVDNGRHPVDVSKENAGYDIRSTGPDMLKRYIEVKGRNGNGPVMLSENEMNRLNQLGENAWLYIVTDCKSKPVLHLLNNPAQTLRFEKKIKGVQYLLKQSEWMEKASNG